MFINNINPVLLNLGPFDIRYYGLFYGIGFLFSYFMLKHIIKKHKTNVTLEMLDDFFIYIMIGGLLGARIFYTLVYQFSYYVSNPLRILEIWNGGMSFHGGLLGSVLAVFLFIYIHNKKQKNKTKKLHFYDIADLAVIPFALALALGRIGNFTNQELYGRITNVPWAVKFNTAEGFRHPSQLYESLYSLTIFGILWWLKGKKIMKGMLFWSFVSLYGIFRFIIEFFRQPDTQMGANGFIVGWLTTGQILCSIMIISGIIALYYLYKKQEKQYE